MSTQDFITEENRNPDRRRVHLSPSGKYSLTVDSYTTGKGTWNYTRGRVFRAEGDTEEPIADVARNYSSFPFQWLENHGDTGHDYLLCGADYQGQTFIDLTTGQRRDFVPEEAKEGFGFCWAAFKALEDGRTLLVDGCYWACPYEYRFYDVSDPIEKGWPELKIPDELGCLYASDKGTTVGIEDGLIVWREGERIFKATGERESAIERVQSGFYSALFKAKHLKRPQEEIDEAEKALREHQALYPDEEEDADRWERVIDHVVKLRREDDKLVLAEEWKSEHRLEMERRRAEWEAKSKAERQKWIAEDSLLAALKADGVSLEGRVSFMYPSQASRWDGETNPAYFTVLREKYNFEVKQNHTATLEWGVDNGDITLKLWVRGKGDIAKPTFPRTVDGLRAAWAAAGEHLAAEVA